MIEKDNTKTIGKYDLKDLFKSDDDGILNSLIDDVDSYDYDLENITLESNIYIPLNYQVEDNCPTCGYRTPASKKIYNYDYLKGAIFYQLDIIKQHDINIVNCYHEQKIRIDEYRMIYDILDEYDIDVNVKISDHTQLELIDKYDFNSLIINVEDNDIFDSITNEEKFFNRYNIILELDIYNPRKLDSNIKVIEKLDDYKIDFIDIRGFNPFFDSPQEYHPQYTREYLLKTISILRILYPDIKLKVQYATNGRNYFNETLKLGITNISGVYANKLEKIYNYEEVIEQLKP